MITLKELNPHNYLMTKEVEDNLHILLERINIIRTKWGRSMIITSGLRSNADQMRINPKAPLSRHCIGAACDVSDPNRELQIWIKANVSTLETVGLWCESFDATANWIHFQIYPPKSGKRFFNP